MEQPVPRPRIKTSRELHFTTLDLITRIVFTKRYLAEYIQEDLDKKIILLTGPRQTGKTTLSKMLANDFDYFSYDNLDDRLSLRKNPGIDQNR